MALNACRLPLHPADFNVSEVVVARFMATLTHLNEQRTMVTSIYVPEVPLQEATAHLLCPLSSVLCPLPNFDKSLEVLQDTIRSGHTSRRMWDKVRGSLGC